LWDVLAFWRSNLLLVIEVNGKLTVSEQEAARFRAWLEKRLKHED
jgi:hypothetical protein